MENKICLRTLQMQFLLIFFLLAGWSLQSSVSAQQPLSESAHIQPQDLRKRLAVPQNLIRQTLTTVPNLEGMQFNEQVLQQFLKRYDLNLGNTVPVVNNENIGIIISQTPPSRRRVIRGTEVNVTYGIQGAIVTPGKPEENVRVPNYVGLTLERATSRMPNDRLQPGNIKESPLDAEAGIVIDQFPEEGMVVDPQTPIDLTISSGPPEVVQIPVPDLRGLTLEQAARVLRNSKLFAGQLNEEVSDERPGTILSQSPQPGTMVPLESDVDITFSVPEEDEGDVIVPNVTGFFRDKAIRILKDSRLNYLLKYEKRYGEPENMVLEQDPLPETRVPAGTNVQLVLQKQETVPPWVYWAGGVLAAGLLGGFAGRKLGSKKGKNVGRKDIKLKLKPVLDEGKQTIVTNDKLTDRQYLQLKPIPDKGTQTIKTN